MCEFRSNLELKTQTNTLKIDSNGKPKTSGHTISEVDQESKELKQIDMEKH